MPRGNEEACEERAARERVRQKASAHLPPALPSAATRIRALPQDDNSVAPLTRQNCELLHSFAFAPLHPTVPQREPPYIEISAWSIAGRE